MGNLVQYSINIAMETTIILVLAIMLVTLFLQKKFFSTTIPLIFLTSFIILMLIVQIITWCFLINDVPVKYGAMPMRVVYILDYLIYHCVSFSFYCYVEALIKDGYKQIETTYTPKKNIKKLIIIWGVVNTLIYSVSLFIPSIYHLEDGKAVFSIISYLFMQFMIKFAVICTVILIIHHRKVIEKHELTLILSFITIISIIIIADELIGLCISYILLSIFVFILYVSIDLHKGLLLERKEKELVEWKTKIMLSQMQPHFLYNVLTTISGMCEMQNATEARDVVNHFADYFRTNLDSLGKERTISFEKELEHIKTYLWLEKIRFEDGLNIRYEIETIDFMVPSLTVQPIVENAVKHGILPKEESGTVTIRTYETSLDYVIVVEDDGVGFDPNEINDNTHSHIGIENVSKRLEIICNGSCEIKSSKGKGTIVTIHIPKGD